MKTFRSVIGYFVGWPGLALLVVVVVAAGMYIDARNFTPVEGKTSIRNLLEGHTLKAEGYTFFYAGDGTAFGGVGGNYDVGTWEALDDVYCEQWEIWGEGLRRCWTLKTNGDRVKRTGTGFPFNENDPTINELQRVEGNQVYSR